MLERLFLRAASRAVAGGDPLDAIDPKVLTGPMLIGVVLNVWLFGMQLMQVETYFRSSPRDPKWIKALVLFLLLADTLNSVFDVWFTYDYNVNMFGDKLSIINATWVFNTDPVMTVISSSSVQAFFAWRVQKLTGQTWLAVCVCISAFVQFLAGLGVSIACGIVKEFAHFHTFKSIVIVWLVLAPLTDIVISVSLVWFLQRNKTGFAVTDDLVGKITRVTIQTGAITAVWATVDLAIFLCFANNLHLIFNMPLSKLYSNCLMSSLNARRQWSGSSYTSDDHPHGSNKKDIRGGIQVTTTTGVQESYELDTRGRPFDGTIPIGGTTSSIGDVKRKPIDDGLSLRSDSLNSDEGVDALGSSGRQKLADEETNVVSHHFPTPPTVLSSPNGHTPPPTVGLNGAIPPLPSGQRRVNLMTPNVATRTVPQQVARGGRSEVNVEWSTAL